MAGDTLSSTASSSRDEMNYLSADGIRNNASDSGSATSVSREQTAISVAASIVTGGRTTPIIIGQEASDNLLFKMISFQGWLSKFCMPLVRKAFLKGNFNIRENTEAMLETIDFLMEILLPYPHIDGEKFPMSLLGVEFFNKLMKQNNSEPTDQNGQVLPVRKTFHDWSMYLGELSVSRYWIDLKKLDQSSKSYQEFKTQTDELSSNATQSNPNSTDDGTKPKIRLLTEIINREKPKTQSSSFVPIKEEPNYRTNYRNPLLDYQPLNTNLEDVLRNINKPKKVVAPRIFSGKDGTSLKDHLTEFEAYFDTKYEGTDRQKSQLLESFLEGKPLKAYEALEGSRMNYCYLKPELLHWYSSERTSARARSENEFRRTKMSSGDSLTVFGMRLERLAAKAFPDSRAERERQLIRKFWKSVPESFQRVIADGERQIALNGGPNKQ